jgi:hypothetical protein
MRIEFVPKVKATIQDIDIQSLKRGQTDVEPAVCLHLKITQANNTLAMLDKALLPFLYQKGADHSKQQVLDGVPVVSEYPSLSPAAVSLGALGWDGEQTGATLKIYQGVTGDLDITLHDCTVRKVKIDAKEGGAVDWSLQIWSSDVDQDTLGALAVLKSLEREIELVAATVAQQGELDEAEEQTPEKALAGAVGG